MISCSSTGMYYAGGNGYPPMKTPQLRWLRWDFGAGG